MNNRIKGAAICSVVFIQVFYGIFAMSARAASAYDNVVSNVDNLEIANLTNPADIRDLSINWYNNALEAVENICATPNTAACNLAAEIDNFLDDDNGNWAVVLDTPEGTGNATGFRIYYSTSPDAEMEFYMDGTTPALRLVGTEIVQTDWFLVYPSWGTESVDDVAYAGSGWSYKGTSRQVTSEASALPFYLSTFPITYPTGYEGEEIDSGSVPPTSEELNMDMHWQVIDKELSIRDVSDYGNYNVEECYVQLPDNQLGDAFTQYIYDCNNPEWIKHIMPNYNQTYLITQFVVVDGDVVTKQYSVVIDGSTYDSKVNFNDIYEDCMNDEFPYIHIGDCMAAFGDITNTMSFGHINPLNNFVGYEETHACRELGVLGDWLGLDNKTVCPQFSSTVRNTITPFMSFGLALGVLGSIINKTSKEFN